MDRHDTRNVLKHGVLFICHPMMSRYNSQTLFIFCPVDNSRYTIHIRYCMYHHTLNPFKPLQHRHDRRKCPARTQTQDQKYSMAAVKVNEGQRFQKTSVNKSRPITADCSSPCWKCPVEFICLHQHHGSLLKYLFWCCQMRQFISIVSCWLSA